MQHDTGNYNKALLLDQTMPLLQARADFLNDIDTAQGQFCRLLPCTGLLFLFCVGPLPLVCHSLAYVLFSEKIAMKQ